MSDDRPSGDGASTGELVLYSTEDGQAHIHLRLVGGTVWLTQAEMAQLFDATPQNIGQHLKNIYEEGELSAGATRKKFFQVRQEGSRPVRREVKTYNLDMILAVGYRVRSPRGIQFRYWASTVLREYLVKGFVLDDARLKEPGGLDYFDELLERIRDIRASEKRFYQKIREVLAATSVDYLKSSQESQTFFATVQNKFIYAVTGQTAAELVVQRCDPERPNMGLTSWSATRVRKVDVTVSKNYLVEDEIGILNQLTTQFLDFAELKVRRRQQTTMAEWIPQTDRFLQLNEFSVLSGAGKVGKAAMEEFAHSRYEEFAAKRRVVEAAETARDDATELRAIAERTEPDLLAELEAAQAEVERRRPAE